MSNLPTPEEIQALLAGRISPEALFGVEHSIPRFMGFAHDLQRNAWYESKQIKVYCRKAMHVIGKDPRLCFDLANVQVVREADQHKGLFKQIVNALKRWPPVDIEGLYVETVQTPQFVDGLKRMGFEIVEDRWSDFNPWPCMYLSLRSDK